ncbi:V-type ATP synthase subunit E [Streptomyces sp. SCSIO 30461]|uniref:V-type ATP synthase subunit E n=1 Tax=Streptomyces sp. SCSIO 30461 TaxID=3118085 RepID=UPI0030D0D08B
MKSAAPDHASALAPVREELLRSARADAEEVLARAGRDAEALLDAARARAAAILDDARRHGEAEATRGRTAELTRVRRTIRARELGVRRQAYEELRRRAAERVRDLRDTADYPVIRDRLHQRARRLLGPGARVTEHPSGGFVAQAAGCRADCSLDALAARVLDRFCAETETLWAP